MSFGISGYRKVTLNNELTMAILTCTYKRECRTEKKKQTLGRFLKNDNTPVNLLAIYELLLQSYFK